MSRFLYARWWLYCLAILFVSGCDVSATGPRQPVYSLAVSSDGKYVLSAHGDRSLLLWNLDARNYRLISRNANIYSAGFVRGRPVFIWQDLDRVVHVNSIDGTELKSWVLKRDSYGHLLAPDLETYVYSDEGYGIHVRQGARERTIKQSDPGTFLGTGKIFNLDLSPDGRTLLSAGDCSPYFGTAESYRPEVQAQRGFIGYECLILWDIQALKPIAKLPGNIAKTHATFSPDGRYVVSGDENGHLIFWDINRKRRIAKGASLFHGILRRVSDTGNLDKDLQWDKTGLIKAPHDYHGERIISVKFIGKEYFLRIASEELYAILYSIDSPLPLKYLDLGTRPFPATRDYSRNTAIDTAPAAGILVMGQAAGPGINVYKYDKATQTLKRIWVAR